MQVIKVNVDGEGKAKIEFEGFVGTNCTSESARIKELLAQRGVDIGDEVIQYKPEYDLLVVAEEASRLPAQRQLEGGGN